MEAKASSKYTCRHDGDERHPLRAGRGGLGRLPSAITSSSCAVQSLPHNHSPGFVSRGFFVLLLECEH